MYEQKMWFLKFVEKYWSQFTFVQNISKNVFLSHVRWTSSTIYSCEKKITPPLITLAQIIVQKYDWNESFSNNGY